MTAVKPKSADPLQAAGNVYSLIMENDKVRVLDALFKPGATAAMHYHPNHVVYIVVDGKFKVSTPDGKSVDLDLKKGQAIWMEEGQHSAQNLGKTEGHNLVVELKK